MEDYFHRKDERRKAFLEKHGKKMVTCTACNGSGRYDNNGAPKCASCGRTGKTREDCDPIIQ